MAARARKKRPKLLRLGVSPPLTRAEVRQLKARAKADLRSISNYVGHLVAQDLKRAGGQGSGDPPAGGGKREPYSIALYLTASERRQLEAKAAADRRSVSGYVGKLILGALSGP